jgi:hypothetical protein
VSAIAFAQHLNPVWEAKLIEIPRGQDASQSGPQWTTEFEDEERRRYHEQKMRTKDTRPAAQMERIGTSIPQGTVRHILAASSLVLA